MTDTDYTADEFLDWLCWTWAQDGERFYPPKETAEECVEELIDDTDDAISRDMMYQMEYGEHCRAYTEATMKFDDAVSWGFDPIERAAREHRDLMERADGAIDPIDWTWLGDRETQIDSLVARLDREE